MDGLLVCGVNWVEMEREAWRTESPIGARGKPIGAIRACVVFLFPFNQR